MRNKTKKCKREPEKTNRNFAPFKVEVAIPSGRGTALEVRQRQDTACNGRGKRSLVRLPGSLAERRGKRRQHGGQRLDGEDGEGAEAADDGSQDGAPEYKDIPYTRREQVSPGRYRGHRTPFGAEAKKKRGR